MLISYHNHTNWSDGSPTLEQQIRGARELGLDELGISDHYVLHPDGTQVDWGLPLDWLGGYVRELQNAAQATDGLTIRLGVEADYFPETVGRVKEMLAEHPFDFIVASVHYVGEFPVDADRRLWDPLSEERINEVWQAYWGRIRDMAADGLGDFVGHLDLPKKYGHRPTADFRKEQNEALDAIREADMAVEINTAGWSLSAQEAYPSLELLKQARRREIPLLINADAHSPAHLTRNFDRARELAREAGYSEVVRYEKRERFSYAL